MPEYAIKPGHLNTKKQFWKAFDTVGSNTSARILVELAQKNRSWKSFTRKEINDFIEGSFAFNGLDTSGYIKEGPDKVYSFTHKFIVTCFKDSPIDNVVHRSVTRTIG